MKTDFRIIPLGWLLKTMVTPALLLALGSGCKAEPEPLAYGSDACHFCRMTIVDQQHGAEMVTGKGKVYKFDAVECMLNHLGEADSPDVAFLLVNTYSRPGELLDATEATYLVSEGIPSPMGAFLTAFESKTAALEAREQHGGEVFSWDGIKRQLKK